MENRRVESGFVEEDEIDLKELFGVIKKHKLMITLITILFTVVGATYAYYKESIYEAEATVKIASESKNTIALPSMGGMLQAFGMGGSNGNIDMEMAIMASRKMVLKVIDEVDISSHIWRVSPLRKRVELDKIESPFFVEIDKGENILFNLHIIDENSFLLSTKGSLLNGEEFKYEKKHNFDTVIQNRFFNIKIFKNRHPKIFLKSGSDFQIVNNKNPFEFKDYQFMKEGKKEYFVENLLKKGLLNLSPANKSLNSVISIKFQDSVPLRAKEFVNLLAKKYIEEKIEDKNSETDQIVELIDEQLNIIGDKLTKSAKNLENFEKKEQLIDISQNAQIVSDKLAGIEKELSMLNMQIKILEDVSNKVKHGKNLSTINISGIGIDDQNINGLIAKLQDSVIKRQELNKRFTKAHPDVQKITTRISQLRTIIYKSISNLLKILKEKEKLVKNSALKYEKELSKLPEAKRNYLFLTRNLSLNSKFYSYLLEKKTETEIKRRVSINKTKMFNEAITPLNPIKPKRKLIVIVSLISGFILSIFIVFFREFLNDKIRDEKDIKSISKSPLLATIPKINRKNWSSLKNLFSELFLKIKYLDIFKTPFVIMISSANNRDGKSFISSNFASTISSEKNRVVIVDFNVENPQISKVFKLQKNDKDIIGELSFNPIQTDIENLNVVEIGSILNSYQKVLEFDFNSFFEDLKKDYDLIILDTPNIDNSLSQILLKYSDLLLYVIKANSSKYSDIEKLEQINGENIFFILNMITKATK